MTSPVNLLKELRMGSPEGQPQQEPHEEQHQPHEEQHQPVAQPEQPQPQLEPPRQPQQPQTVIEREHTSPQGHDLFQPPTPPADTTGKIVETLVQTPSNVKIAADRVISELKGVVKEVNDEAGSDADSEATLVDTVNVDLSEISNSEFDDNGEKKETAKDSEEQADSGTNSAVESPAEKK